MTHEQYTVRNTILFVSGLRLFFCKELLVVPVHVPTDGKTPRYLLLSS